MKSGTVLIVEDETLQRWAVKSQLERWGYLVLEAEDGRSALDAYAEQLPDAVLLDFRLPDQTGLDVLRGMMAINAAAMVIMITAHGVLDDAVEAFRLGLFDFLSKPVDFEALRVALRFGLEARRLRTEVNRWRESDRRQSGTTIIGSSPEMGELVAQMRKIAASGATTILLQGESGTGKDLLAKAIHYQGSRPAGPFVPVNCAAVPEPLLESELFGHERGAFTDASAMKQGLLELADGGTIYLDEIGELKPGLQAKLLRVLETFAFRRVGGVREIHVDVRVIAASNKDLARAVQAGEFRSDLFYRLNVIRLEVPPLRSRREDIPALVDFFLNDFNVRFRKSITAVAPEAMARLQRHDWPGNVRELRNAIERAVLLEDGDTLTLRYMLLPETIPPGTSPGQRSVVLTPEGTSLERVEEDLVRQAMVLAGGNQTKAARLLDISRDALRYKLKKFNVS